MSDKNVLGIETGSIGSKTKMTDNDKISQLLANCGYIKRFCRNNESAPNRKLSVDCEQLAESAKLISKISNGFVFKGLRENGFTQFLRVITAYTDLMVGQIKAKNRVDHDLLRLFKLIFGYRDWLLEINEELKKDATGSRITNGQLFVKNTSKGSRVLYNLIR